MVDTFVTYLCIIRAILDTAVPAAAWSNLHGTHFGPRIYPLQTWHIISYSFSLEQLKNE